jgi:hypothetical protein
MLTRHVAEKVEPLCRSSHYHQACGNAQQVAGGSGVLDWDFPIGPGWSEGGQMVLVTQRYLAMQAAMPLTGPAPVQQFHHCQRPCAPTWAHCSGYHGGALGLSLAFC